MIIQDEEFGKVTVRRSPRATQIRIRIAPDGTLRASIPLYAPIFLLKRLLKSSRTELRTLLNQTQPNTTYTDGMQIGKSHSLRIKPIITGPLKISRHGQHITVALPPNKTIEDADVARRVRDSIIAALRLEAKSYLPKRLSYLSDKLGLTYTKVRFSHASGRWGSCSSAGTISLNIALMKLPFELIDYVIVHELSHTTHMNHSTEFWKLVESGDPEYKAHRRALKAENPSI
ncbi:M48 family peptidase [Patescibacteria group bacterium]|nr:MAG: M48 family peptidase [Patescibacteria group bacterium]